MKIKLIRVVALLFALSSFLSLASMQPAKADAASDQQALTLIAQCHGKQRGGILQANCEPYFQCQSIIMVTELCKSIRKLDSANLVLSDADITKCVAQNHKREACIANYGQCLNTHLTGGKVSAADAKACAATTAKGGFADNDRPNKEEKKETKCIITGIGWIVCPVMNFMALLVDTSYDFVSSLLTVQPLYVNGQGGASEGSAGTYQAWSIMRNIANVAFVAAFLVIIFSQVTSFGITNYGIKRMLPRLVIAAILVNVSYWVCAIAVDISNILGTSFGDLFKSLKAGLADPTLTGFNSGGTGWVGITGAVLAGTIATAAIAYIGLSALLPILIAALLAIVTVFLVLTLRQALIILLIVISPLAFVAYLLPNTEQYFKKWKDLLQTLLLMYPIIAIIFGASSLASQIVMGSAPDTNYKIAIQIMGAGIAIIPLFITPIVMKTAGGLLNRFGGFVNNPNKGPFDRMRKAAQGYRDYRQDVNRTNRLGRAGKLLGGTGGVLGDQYSRRRRAASFLGSAGATGSIDREQRRRFAKAIGDESSQEYFANRAINQEGFAQSMAGGDELKGAGMQASAQAAVKKIFDQDVANREVLLRSDARYKNNPQLALQEAIASGNAVQAVAAQNMLFKSGSSGVSNFRDVMQSAEADPQMAAGLAAVTSRLKTNVQENHGKYAKEKGADVVKWANNEKTLSSTTSGTLSDNELAGQHSASMEKMAANGQISADQASRVLKDPRVSANLDDAKKEVLNGVINSHNEAKTNQDAAFSSYGENVQATQQREQNEAFSSYDENVQATQRREQDEAYDTYRDNIR